VVAEGKAAVRQLLVQRLDEAGLVRMKSVTADAHARMLDRLAEKLAYLSAANLMVLAECVIDYSAHAAGVGRGAWPAEVLIIGWAHGLQTPTPQTAPIVASWLRSIEGPVADVGGYLVELYRHLIRHPVPVMAFTLTKIKEEARDNQRRQALMRDRIARGVDGQEDRQWLQAYLSDEREARALVDLGKAGRMAAKGEAA
jgi:hypothetical protein